MDRGLIYLRYWMVISAVMYFTGMLVFLFGQNRLLEQINNVSERLFKERFPKIPLSSEKFWLVLTTSMMLMLVVICVFVGYKPDAFLEMVIILLVSKFCSTSFYMVLFVKERYFAHLIGALTDGPLFLITLFFFLRAV